MVNDDSDYDDYNDARDDDDNTDDTDEKVPGWREHQPVAHTSSINNGNHHHEDDGYDHWWMIMIENKDDGDENTNDGDDDDDRKERSGRQNGLWPDWDSGWGICPPLSVQPPTSTMSATRPYHIWQYKIQAVP